MSACGLHTRRAGQGVHTWQVSQSITGCSKMSSLKAALSRVVPPEVTLALERMVIYELSCFNLNFPAAFSRQELEGAA